MESCTMSSAACSSRTAKAACRYALRSTSAKKRDSSSALGTGFLPSGDERARPELFSSAPIGATLSGTADRIPPTNAISG
ncbi:MAG: hypothetical protein ACYC3O_01370 [Burkholderiales bacterium]